MLRYFTRKDSEFIKEHGDLVHERVRVIHSDGKNVILDDDGETYVIPNEFIDNTFDLFNEPYYGGENLDRRLNVDFKIDCNDTQTPFSIFSRNPLQIGGKHFFDTIFSNDEYDEYDESEIQKQNTRKNTRKNIKSGKKLITKLNKTRKLKN